MAKSRDNPVNNLGIKLVSLIPWLAAMFLLYWLEASGIWQPTTYLRDAMTGGIVVAGMGASFFLFSYLARKKK